MYRTFTNMQFPSCCEPYYEREAKCKTFRMKISFVCIWMKTNFHNKNFELSLAFIMRFKATRKWSLYNYCSQLSFFLFGRYCNGWHSVQRHTGTIARRKSCISWWVCIHRPTERKKKQSSSWNEVWFDKALWHSSLLLSFLLGRNWRI